MKNFFSTSALFSAALCALALPLTARTDDAKIRIVPCDAPVKSEKRGVCVNQMDAKDFMALSPSVSWFYTWHFTPTMDVPVAAHMEFLPMVWGARPESLAGLETYLADHHPRRVLALNEPNLKGQAFISPAASADWFKQVKAVADKHKIPVVGPHMALGSADGDSIKAYDPIEKKEVTYTYMVPFVKAFLNYMGEDEVSAIGAHSYGNFGELNWMTGMLNDEFKRPAWITEFAWWGASDLNAERDYMIQAVDLFERTPNIKGYAWFKERADNEKISLLGKAGELTMLGQTYVQMPVHDPNVYYRLPGRLQAESYLTASKANIALTTDDDGFLEMQPDGGSTLDYQVAVEKAGKFGLGIRCKTSADTRFDVMAGEVILASARASAEGWQTVQTSVELPAGTQTLRVRPSAYTRFNWMEFGAL